MIKKLLDRNIQYNFLSLFNVFIGFLFILYLGRKFGASSQTDIYFLSMVIISYLGYFIQAIWEAMSPYYIEKRIKDKKKSDELYSILLNDLILVSFIVVVIYFIFIFIFNVISNQQKDFLNIFIFYIIFQNILLFNKTILNLEHFYASYYFVDIFVYLVLFFTVFYFVEKDITYIAYATLIGTFFANLWQFYLIHKKLNIKYSFIFYNSNIKEIYKNSFKLKLGSFLYGSKDIIIAAVFTSLGNGLYSLYSYANKFAGVIMQVVNAPIINIFATKATYNIANLKYDLLKTNIKNVLSQTVVLFILCGGIIYFVLPNILNLLFDDKFSKNDILVIQKIFLLLSVFFLISVVQSPYGRLLTIFKEFTFQIYINFIFAGCMIVIYFICNKFEYSYDLFLILLIFSQLIQFLLNYFFLKNKRYL